MDELFEGEIIDLSSKGIGVVKHSNGQVFFVKGTWPGDKGIFKIESSGKRYGHAELVELRISSKHRVKAKCPHQGSLPGKCGNCPWMIADYNSQLKFKLQRIKYVLSRHNIHLSDEMISEVIPSDKIFGHRNRAQLKTDGDRIGFVSVGTKVLAPIDDCLVLSDKVRVQLRHLIEGLPNKDLKPTEDYKWNFIDIDEEINAQEIVPNKRRPFRQGNTFQNEKMKEWLREQLVPMDKKMHVLELFCGSGNFTEVISTCGFSNIGAVETKGQALENLKRRELFGVTAKGVDLYRGGVWQHLGSIFSREDVGILILDPPREGLKIKKGLYEAFFNIEHIVYISCDVDSFSSDARDFIDRGFALTKISAIDQFPHTPHVEILGYFEKKRV